MGYIKDHIAGTQLVGKLLPESDFFHMDGDILEAHTRKNLWQISQCVVNMKDDDFALFFIHTFLQKGDKSITQCLATFVGGFQLKSQQAYFSQNATLQSKMDRSAKPFAIFEGWRNRILFSLQPGYLIVFHFVPVP